MNFGIISADSTRGAGASHCGFGFASSYSSGGFISSKRIVDFIGMSRW